MGCLKLVFNIVPIVIIVMIQMSTIEAQELNLSGKIIINVPSYTLEYYENDELLYEYPVAIGKPSTPTPLGSFSVIEKEVNPCWYPPEKKGYTIPSGPDNPLGFRWMGIINNYGIHGTNAPWSIGEAVSNGCIRMYEEDVEALFSRVQSSTPVQIIYEPIQIRINNQGQVFIAIYPDIYQRAHITLSQMKDKLRSKGLEYLIADDFLIQLMKTENGHSVLAANVSTVRINNKILPEYLVCWNDIQYISVRAIASYLETTIEWEEDSKTIRNKQQTAPAMVKNNRLYVAINELPILFGIKQSWDARENCLFISTPELLQRGQFVTRNIQVINNQYYVPIDKVAGILGRKLDWDKKSNTFWLASRKIAITMLDDNPYIEISKISEYFNVHVTCDAVLQTLDMDYSCCENDYSMYLAEMGEFTD